MARFPARLSQQPAVAMKIPVPLLVAGLLATATPLSGATLLYDGFNYTGGVNLIGQVNPGNGNTWTEVGSSTTHSTIAAGSLTYAALQLTGNRVQLASFSSSTKDAGLAFTGSGPDLYYSFLLRLDNVSGMGTAWQGILRVINGSNNGLGVFVRQNGSTFDLGIHKRFNSGAVVTDTRLQSLSTGTPHFIVVKYETGPGTGDDLMKIWVNPSTGVLGISTEPAATFSSNAGNDISVVWNNIQLFPPNQTSGFFDELRVATTWAEVTAPSTTQATPAITTQPADQSACSGDTATFSVTATGGSLGYSWAKRGTGWGNAWSFSGGGGLFRGTSTGNNSGDPACNSLSSALDINSASGNALGIYCGSGTAASATRTFPALNPGEVVGVDLDNGNVDSGKKVGFSLQTSGGTDLLQFYFLGGQANYKYHDGTERDTGIGFMRTGLRVHFVLGTNNTYTLIVTPCGGATRYYFGSYPAGSAARLRVFNENTSGGSDYDFFVNNLLVGGYTDAADNYTGGGSWAGSDVGDQPLTVGNGTSSYTTPPLAFPGDSGTQYRVLIFNGLGTLASSAATLTVNPAATAHAGPDQTVLPTVVAVTLAGSVGGGATGGTWSGGTGTFSPDANTLTAGYTPTAAEKAARTLTLTLTSTGQLSPCGPAVDTLTVTFNTPPVAQPLTLGVAQGDNATLTIIGGKHPPTDADNDSVTVSGASPLWTSNGGTVAIVGTTGVKYTAPNNWSGTDTFSYTVSDDYGGTDTQAVTVTVYPASGGANIQSLNKANDTVTIKGFGIPGWTYRLQSTTSLSPVNWQDVTGSDQVASDTGSLTFTDDPGDVPPARYYRLRYVGGL
jgi:hypothetical protein